MVIYNNGSTSRRAGSSSNNRSTSNGNNGYGDGVGSNMSLYGHRSFQNGAAAHDFINSALNSGNYVGTVAAATSLTPGVIMRNTETLRSYTTTGRVNGRTQTGFPVSALGNALGIHPMPGTAANRRRIPCPSSALVVIAEIRDPPRTNGRSPYMGRLLDSGFGSPTSQASSCVSSLNSDCECDECRHCVCHLFCQEHASMNCPVHGRGGLGRGRSGSNSDSGCHYPTSGSSSDCDFSSPRS